MIVSVARKRTKQQDGHTVSLVLKAIAFENVY